MEAIYPEKEDGGKKMGHIGIKAETRVVKATAVEKGEKLMNGTVKERANDGQTGIRMGG